MNTFTTSSNDVRAMVKALKKAGLPIEKTPTSRLVSINGMDIFRAMKGSDGSWLVSHHEKLFV